MDPSATPRPSLLIANWLASNQVVFLQAFFFNLIKLPSVFFNKFIFSLKYFFCWFTVSRSSTAKLNPIRNQACFGTDHYSSFNGQGYFKSLVSKI